LHQWTKKSSEKLLGEVAKLHTKKELLMNLLQMRHEKRDEKADGAVVHDDKNKNPELFSGFLFISFCLADIL
jgi:hypothetical protein